MGKLAYKIYALITAAIIVAGGAGIAWGMHFGASKLPLRQYFSQNYTNAVWDWSNPAAKTQHDLNELSDFMYLHQLNAVYVDVGQYAALVDGQMDDKKAAAKQTLEDALIRYITTLKKRDVKVYAAAGDVTWSNPDKRHIPMGVLRAVQEYNQQHKDAAFSGVEFDIESYNQEGFSTGSITVKTLVLTDYLDMVDELAAAAQSYVEQTGASLELGFAIPYWFDNQNGNIPSVTWREKTGPTLYHLLDRLNTLPQSNVVVMAYRNAARGNDGVLAHSRTEVEYAQAKAPNVAVLIGQEVNDVKPAKITYFGQSTTELSAQVKAIEDAYTQIPTFRGIAINDLAALKELERQKG
ncbi:MAG: hypothetical protein ACREGJ_03160 [Candidatus Saccharimonadales bacterium]